MADIFEIQERAKEALRAEGIQPPEWIEPEKFCYLPTDDGSDKSAGRCRLHVDNPPTLWICNHYRHDEKGITVSLRGEDENSRMSDEEYQAFLEQVEQNKKQREAERKKRQDDVAEKARKEVASLPPAGDDNPYLKRKGVHAVDGLKQNADGLLVIPAYDASGKVVTLQRVPEIGDKLFMSGGKAAGTFFPVCSKKDGPLILAEGIATALSIHEATDCATWSCFDCGHLMEVAKLAREKFPDREIIIAGDEDTTKKDADGNLVKRMPEKNAGRIKAMKAAEAIGARCVICPEVDDKSTDFNDLHQARGQDAVRKALEAAKPVAAAEQQEEWNEIVTFASDEHPVIDFKRLPPMLAGLCEGLAEEIQVPADMVLGVALSAFSATAQRSYSVEMGPEWEIFVNLYILITMDKSNRKSPVFKRLTAPIREWQAQMDEVFKPLIRRAVSRRESDKKRINKLREKLAVTDDDLRIRELQDQIDRIEDEMPEVPRAPKIVVEDITPERLISVMSRNSNRISILSSECDAWETLGGRYADIPNFGIYLKGYDGEAYDYGRSKDGGCDIVIENAIITFGIMGQTSCMRSRVNADKAKNRGIDCRFAFIIPESNIGYRKAKGTPLNPNIGEWYKSKIKGILEEYDKPKRLKLSQEADELLVKFSETIEVGMRPGGELASMTDWFGKLHSKTVKIAAILHIIENDTPESKEISGNTMRTAIYIAGYLGKHAKIAYAMMGSDDVLDKAKLILEEFIIPKKVREFSKHDCHVALRGRAEFNHADNMDAPLKELCDRWYLRKKDLGAQKSKKGRPSGPVYEVNPALFKG